MILRIEVALNFSWPIGCTMALTPSTMTSLTPATMTSLTPLLWRDLPLYCDVTNPATMTSLTPVTARPHASMHKSFWARGSQKRGTLIAMPGYIISYSSYPCTPRTSSPLFTLRAQICSLFLVPLVRWVQDSFGPIVCIIFLLIFSLLFSFFCLLFFFFFRSLSPSSSPLPLFPLLPLPLPPFFLSFPFSSFPPSSPYFTGLSSALFTRQS